jgi:2',3'-cyclic-nucleotide 2'-phosphodiesterase / 3'-nucleotidase / 5'-nucleotidase
MKKIIYKFLCFLLLVIVGTQIKAQINAQLLGRYSIGTYNADGGVAEISAYDPSSKRMFVTNGPDNSLRIVNMANPASPVQISTISMAPYGSDITSVACNKKGIIAAAILDSNGKTNASSIVFLDINGNFISKVKVGANADNVVFTPNGQKVLVANEGEPNVGYTIDPEGSVSIIDVAGGFAGLTQSNVQTAGFTAFNAPTVIDSKIKITGKIQIGTTFSRNSTVAEDLEPEYITVSEDNSTAWVTCQENNAIAVVNINTATVTSLLPLGFKNHNLIGNGLDPSDRSLNNTTAQAAIANWPVFGMYQPDAISSYKAGSQTFLVTANEGDARADWGSANNEEVRVGNSSYVLDSTKFGGSANVALLKANGALGRLNVTNRFGDFDNDGKFDSIFTYGARSFSIWNGTTGALVWDSRDDFEQRTLAMFPNNFNAGHNTNSLDDRSDNKGPEPESVTVGKILDSTYAFVGLERIGGIMIYNITNPSSPYFVQYINTRDFSQTPGLNSGGDLGPEGIVFVPRNESPNGKDLILLSNEVSGTVAVFQINSRSAFQMQVLHSGDMESGLAAVVDAPNYAAIVDKFEDQHVNTLILSSGDNTLPGPFLSSGEDPTLQTPLRNTAGRYYSGSQALRAAIGRADIAIMNIIGFNASALGNHEFDLGTSDLNGQIGVDIRNNGADKRWIGAQFPYVSCNLNFSADANLNYLYTNQILRDTAFKTSPTITNNNQKRGLAPSVIIERNGQKIGVVGATTQVLAKISSPGLTNVTGPQVDDMPALAAIIQPVVDSLIAKEGVNKIILLAHLQQIANEKALAPLLRNVDIIISGGNHAITADDNDRLLAGNVRTEQYPIITTSLTAQPMIILNNSSEWKYVGRFVCDFDSAGVLLPNLLDSNTNGVYASDSLTITSIWGNYNDAFAIGTKGADVRTICNAVNTVITTKDGNKFGKSNVFLEGRRNFVRTEETNFGNLSSDANLWYARQYDNQVRISIKNGGGIRSAIGFVNAVGSNTILENTLSNPTAGKVRGDISQLDIENSLRFNNGLVIGSVSASGLKRIMEHGIAATLPNATPGQFPQVGGMQFSYDTTRAIGNKILSLVITDSIGNRLDTIVRNGVLHGDTSRTFKLVTLNFLFTGGDSYPFPANATNRVNLDTAIKNTGIAAFAAIGSEQDAFAEYMGTFHGTTPFNIRDTSIIGDRRIQLLNARPDRIFTPLITIASARSINSDTVKVRGIITRAWGRFIYIQDATGAIGVRQSSGTMVDAILNGSLKAGDSVEVSGGRSDFNNYSQIGIQTGVYRGNSFITKIMSNRPLPPVQVLTVKQLLANPESYESELIRIENLRTSSIGSFAASNNYNVWDGTTAGDTTILRVISAVDTEIDDAPALKIPEGQFTFEGTLIQFCSSPTSGCSNGYQLQGVRKGDIIPQLGNFNLLNPANNARVLADSASTSNVQVNWTKSTNAMLYKWMLTSQAGTFTAPLLTLLSNNAGVDSTLTLSSGSVDAILASLGINRGDSVNTKWTVFAYKSLTDSLQASQVFNLTLARSKVLLGSFNLNSPANNISVTVEEGNTSLVNINWTKSSNATRYKWFVTAAAGNFATPFAMLNSNNAGVDTILSLTSGAVDNLLNTLGVKRTDSVNLKWTVFAYLGNDSIKAGQDWNITITRKRILGSFNLSNPTNNASILVTPNSSTPVVINWTASSKATKHIWKAATLAGNFSNPLLNLNADNAGADNKLTLTHNAIDAILVANGVAKGDSIKLQWTVFSYETTDSLKAVETFNITLVRGLGVGINNVDLKNTITVFPNPAQTELFINSNNMTGNMDVKLYSITGQLLIEENMEASMTNKINVSNLQDGIYMLSIRGNNGKNATIKVVIAH